MRACRQKHMALLDIRHAHLHRTNNPVYTLFQAYLAFASTLGEERMSHTAWIGMLAPALLDILVEANKVAGLDGAKAHRYLLRQVKLFATATRDLYRTRYLRMREIRGESRTTLHLRSPQAKHSKRAKARTPPTTAAAHMHIRPFTESQSSRILLTRSTRWSDDHRLESQDEPASRRHRPNTPAGELGLGLQDNDITAAAWDVPLLPDTDSGSDDATKSVVDSIDSNYNVTFRSVVVFRFERKARKLSLHRIPCY